LIRAIDRRLELNLYEPHSCRCSLPWKALTMGRRRLILRGRKARRATSTALVALAVASVLAAVPATRADAATAVVPLSPALEVVRAEAAAKLYGTPDAPAPPGRKTSIVAMGDSEISGEGLRNYVPGTDGPANYCHRSHDSAILKTGLAADVPLNLACSGAQTRHLVPAAQGGGARQYDELNQGDSLAVQARVTRVAMVLLVIGANDDDGIRFGPVMSDCVQRRILFQGNCWPDYTDDWRTRVTSTQANVTTAIGAIRRTLREAGYADDGYQLVVMSYPSPVSPDVEDNPRFPGWYDGGCLTYLKDAAFGRNKAVPMFEQAERAAALSAPGVRYLDSSRLFAGHEACADTPWANGMVFQNGNISDLGGHNTQMSFHPNAAGAAAFAQCVTRFYSGSGRTGTCVDVDHAGRPTVYPGLLEFRRLRDLGSGLCVDAVGYNSRNGTELHSWPCTGGGNQGFWYNPADSTIHSELSQDRCVDVPNGRFAAGAVLRLFACNGTAAQKFTISGEALKAQAGPDLCLGSGTDAYVRRPVTLERCASPAAGRFAWQPQVTALTELRSKNAGRCLDLPGSAPKVTDGMKVTAAACDGLDDQKWWYNEISGRFHNFRDVGYCLDGGDGASPVMRRCAAGSPPGQRWAWEDGGSIRSGAASAVVSAGDGTVRLGAADGAEPWTAGAGLPDRYGFTYSGFIGSRAT
jgi:ricin-type beta-trefoil lectin protein/GDSL-like lipase/acylhydrolase family protein